MQISRAWWESKLLIHSEESLLFSEAGPATLTLLGAGAVGAGAGVGRVLGVARGGAVLRPVKVVVLVLDEHADGLLLKAAVELPWRGAEEKAGSIFQSIPKQQERVKKKKKARKLLFVEACVCLRGLHNLLFPIYITQSAVNNFKWMWPPADCTKGCC